NAFDRYHVGQIALSLVHELHGVDILDVAFFVLAEQYAVLENVDLYQRTVGNGPGKQTHHGDQSDGVAYQARAQQVGFLPGKIVFGCVADQAFGVAHLVHDAVTGVDTGCAADALDLQSVANVDAGRADLNAHGAVDAVAKSLSLVVGVLLARPAALATARVIGDDQGVLVEHHALEACVGAHVDAYLLAQPAGIAVGRQGKEANPEIGPATCFARQQIGDQFADGREIADEGQAGGQADQQPQAVLGRLAQQFVGAQRGLVQFHALVAVTFGDFFAPHENPGPHALRAGIATPDAPGKDGDEEQAEGADDQQPGQQSEVLRPEGGIEYEEFAFRQVPPDGLAVVPVQPDGTEVQEEEKGPAAEAQVAEQAGEGAGVDLLAAGIEVDAIVALGRRSDVSDWNLFAHQVRTTAWVSAPSGLAKGVRISR